MVRRAIALGLLLALLMGARLEAEPRTFHQTVDVTDTSQLITFGFFIHHLVLISDGDNEVFWTITAATATAADIELKNGEVISMSAKDNPMSTVALIATSMETATIRVIGICDDDQTPCGQLGSP